MKDSTKSKAKSYPIDVLVFLGIVIIVFGLFALYFMYTLLSEDYRYEVIDNMFGNPMNIHCVDYDYLAPEFQSIISKDEYYSLEDYNDILDVYRKFNEVNDSKKATTSITTDGFKRYPGGHIIIDGVEYHVESHIDFKTHRFKPQVVRWYVTIKEIEP